MTTYAAYFDGTKIIVPNTEVGTVEIKKVDAGSFVTDAETLGGVESVEMEILPISPWVRRQQVQVSSIRYGAGYSSRYFGGIIDAE